MTSSVGQHLVARRRRPRAGVRRTRAGPSRAAAGAPSTGSARSSPPSGCRRSPRPRPAPARRSRARRGAASAPEREQVVGAADRRERRSRHQQRVDAERAALPVEARADDEPLVERDTGLGQTPAVAGEPLPARRTVSTARQGTRSRRCPSSTSAATIVAIPPALSTPTSGSPSGVRRQVDDGRAVAAHRGEVPLDLLVDRRVVEAAAGEHHAPPRGSNAAAGRTSVSRSASRSEQQVMTSSRRRGGVLDAPDDLGEVRVGDVVDDHRRRPGPALEQAPGERVRDVVECPRRVEDARAGRGADRIVRRRHDARGGRGRHAGEPGDLGDGRQSIRTGTSAARRAPSPTATR